MLDVLEDGERQLPGLACPWQIAGGVAGVAKVSQHVRFVEAVAELPEDAQRMLVAGSGFAEVAQVVLGVAEGVPDSPFDVPVADFRATGERLSAERTS